MDRKTLTTLETRKKSHDFGMLLQTAAQQSGRSVWQIAFDVLRYRMRRHRIYSNDYFKFGLFRTDISPAEKEAFVSEGEMTRINRALAAPAEMSLAGLLESKILTGLVLRAAGLPTSETVAVAIGRPVPLPFASLTGADAVERFLREEAPYPIFGKPDLSRQGIGGASLMKLDQDEIVLGNGTRVGIRALATEIARDYPDGYLFQGLLRPHPALAALIGPVIGTLRVVTLMQAEGPEALFLMLKLPGPGAMVDGGVSKVNGAAIVDAGTGRILRAQLLSRPITEPMTHGHVTGAPLVGAEVSDVNAAVALALQAHRLFPRQGVLGFDIMLTDAGPLINEINLNPGSSLAQSARGAGLMDAPTKERYRAAFAVHGVRLPLPGVRL
ncbi:MAG: hypothetical protein MUE52_04930 [Tabrizicola sp.]|nr:hypothetical protein [Tabrizicola sp.]